MDTEEEILVKVLEYKVRNDLPVRLLAVQSEWATTHTLGSISLAADPIVGFVTSMKEIIISGWDIIDEEELLERVARFPCAYCYVTEVRPVSLFEQEDSEKIQFLAGIKIIVQGTDRSILEKVVYRYTHAVYEMMRDDIYLSDSGWYVDSLTKVYSGTVPTQPLLKAGQVTFTITKPSVS